MKRFHAILPLAAVAALAAAGCASAPSAQDKSLEPFTALDTKARNVLAEEIREPETVVAAVVDVDMRSDPRATLLRYTPVRFRPAANGDLRLHGLERERAFASVFALRDAILKRYAKGRLGIVVFFNGAPAGTRELSDEESSALAEVLTGHLQPMLTESKIPFAWIVPAGARLFPIVQ